MTLKLALLLTTLAPVEAPNAFQNLDFEQANPVSANNPGELYAVTTASAFPGWTVSVGGQQLSQVNYNDPDLGTPTVGLESQSTLFFPPIDGYSALLQNGYPSGPASISQTGLIPAGTESLLFRAFFEPQIPPGELDLSIGSQNVQFQALAVEQNYTLYGANISQWAGQTESLTFSTPANPAANNWLLDDISFSPESVPEPSPAILAALGGLIFATFRRKP